MIYSFDIDEKSLYNGIVNNYVKGQSPTVHTPLKQSVNAKDTKKDIYAFLEGYSNNSRTDLPELLVKKCTSQTTSHANTQIIYFFEFSNISVDGKDLKVDSSFAMYVKEEIDKRITKRDGKCGDNLHYLRQKLHYPTSLCYKVDPYNIDNKKVLDKIIELNGGFAYVVKGFDVDTETKKLNFRTTLVGLKGVWKSNVFIKKKGIGLKLILDDVNFENIDIFATGINKNIKFTEKEADGFYSALEKINISSRKSGLEGEKYVCDKIHEIIRDKTIRNVTHVSKDYPKSPYDIECMIDGEKFYIEVKSTKSDKKYFYMSRGERRFMEVYHNRYKLVLVTNVFRSKKGVYVFSPEDINNRTKTVEEIQGIKYIMK